jgi:hypothetical protein
MALFGDAPLRGESPFTDELKLVPVKAMRGVAAKAAGDISCDRHHGSVSGACCAKAASVSTGSYLPRR